MSTHLAETFITIDGCANCGAEYSASWPEELQALRSRSVPQGVLRYRLCAECVRELFKQRCALGDDERAVKAWSESFWYGLVMRRVTSGTA